VLTILAKHHLNLSKIQSLPVMETPWKYAFFADFIFNSYADYFNALEEVKDKVEMLQVLGEYTKSKR
jgi:prephenate dehydratase